MATAIYSGGRIRTNIPAENAYNALGAAGKQIANSQLRLSTGKRINSAADDVAGYITSKSLLARNGALKAAHTAAGDAKNVTAIGQDALDQITDLVTQIKDATAQASSGALGTDEKVALAKSAYRLAEQVQFITDSTVFGGKQLLQGGFSGDWVTGYYADNKLMTIKIDLTSTNTDEFNIVGTGAEDFDLNATSAATNAGGAGAVAANFAGVEGLSLESLNEVAADDLGIFTNMGEGGTTGVHLTLQSLSAALNNISKVATYLGGIQTRLGSQEETLTSQMTNYKAAISRIEDADVAQEQMNLIKNQFLQNASLSSLAQANQNPNMFLQLIQ
jgi:flagellin